MVEVIVNKVKKTISERGLLEKGDHIVIGLSGGPDSVCLISMLKELSNEWNLTLHAVHVNHCLRGEDADADQRYTENLCSRISIPCHVFIHDVNALSSKWKVTTEEAGRRVRYEAFDEIKGKISAETGKKKSDVKIALAHNANDQAETLVMRIIRGTGTEGLAGMEYYRDGGIIRPLLDLTRDEIEIYCDKKNLKPRIDLTNLEPLYTRNRIRLELLPLLQTKYNENIISSLNRLAKIAQEDREYFANQIEKLKNIIDLNANGDSIDIGLKEYRNQHSAIGKRLIVASLRKIGLEQDMTATHLDEADRLLRVGKTGDMMDLPHSYGLRINYETGVFYSKKKGKKTLIPDANEFSYPLKINGSVSIPQLNGKLEATVSESNSKEGLPRICDRFFACLDLASIDNLEKIVVRNRRPGDYILPLGMKGRKKLQDFFVDNKIPSGKRDLIPLVCCGEEVLWIVGHRINDKYKVTRATSKILCLEYMDFA